ncbi:MAG: hypothetical protein NTY53_07195 [Kiritimatiellaeota bacterium]|nr:hypothetical protein [Kiritimatiellota bacterium]
MRSLLQLLLSLVWVVVWGILMGIVKGAVSHLLPSDINTEAQWLCWAVMLAVLVYGFFLIKKMTVDKAIKK